MNRGASRVTQTKRMHKVRSRLEPRLYTDIVHLILEFLIASQPNNRLRSRALLSYTLVCKEWHHILCKSLFAKIDGINVHGLQILRNLQHSNDTSSKPFQFTFTQYVQHVTIEINMAFASWKEPLELIKRVRELFRKLCVEENGQNLTLSLQNGTLSAHKLADVLACVQHFGHLHLTWAVLDGNAALFKRLLCDQSYPSLRKITINGAGYNAGAQWPALSSSSYLDKIGIHSQNIPDQSAEKITLDELCLLDNFPQNYGRPPRRSVLFWPHELFSDLAINKIIIRVPLGSWSEFWSGVPEMLKHVKASLVELDICSELDYRDLARKTKGFSFPKLQVLKLQICQGTAYRNHNHNLGDTADGLRTLLRQWNTPLLNTIVIHIQRADDTIVGVEKVDKKVFVFQEMLGGIVSPLDWAGVDDAVVEVAERSYLYCQTHDLERANLRCLIVFKHWSGWRGQRLLAYVQGQLPKCRTHGVDIECEVVPEISYDD